MRARALDVDATGRYVLFVDWYGTCRVLDLQRRQRAAAPKFLSLARQRLARRDLASRAAVLPSGDVVSFEALAETPTTGEPGSSRPGSGGSSGPGSGGLGSGGPGSGGPGYGGPGSGGPRHGGLRFGGLASDELRYGGLRLRSADGTDRVIQISDGSALFGLPRGVFASDDGRYVVGLLAMGGERTRIDLVDSAAARLQAVRTVPSVLTAIATDAARSILACAAARDVWLHDLRSLRPLGPGVASRRGRLHALAIAERTLVLAGTDLELHRWRGESLPTEWPPAEAVDVAQQVRGPGHLSLSRDGRLLALRVAEDGVAVLHLAAGSRQLLLERSAGVDLVRFVDHDRRLVVATADGKIHVWQRRGDRLAGAR